MMILEMTMTKSLFRRLLWAAMILSGLVFPGCGPGLAPQPAEKAEAAVGEFLQSWTQGEPPDKFAGAHPKISVVDPDWTAGHRLMSFLSVDTKPSSEDAARYRCRVALSLLDRKGKAVDKEVVYEVLMGKKIVINRVQRVNRDRPVRKAAQRQAVNPHGGRLAGE